MFSALFNGIFLCVCVCVVGFFSLKSAFSEEKKQNHFPRFLSLTKVSILDSKLYTGSRSVEGKGLFYHSHLLIKVTVSIIIAPH